MDPTVALLLTTIANQFPFQYGFICASASGKSLSYSVLSVSPLLSLTPALRGKIEVRYDEKPITTSIRLL